MKIIVNYCFLLKNVYCKILLWRGRWRLIDWMEVSTTQIFQILLFFLLQILQVPSFISSNIISCNTSVVFSYDLWHVRLGHVLRKILKQLSLACDNPSYCDIYPLAKQARLHFSWSNIKSIYFKFSNSTLMCRGFTGSKLMVITIIFLLLWMIIPKILWLFCFKINHKYFCCLRIFFAHVHS